MSTWYNNVSSLDSTDWAVKFCNAHGVNVSITIGDWADGSLFAQLLQSKDPNFQIPSPGATDRRERVRNYEAIMDWVHQTLSPLAGPHPTAIPDASEGNAPLGLEGAQVSETHSLLGLLWLISKKLDRADVGAIGSGSGDVVAPSGANKAEIESLKLLYSSGFIQDEEYRRRLAELSPSSGGAEGPEWEGHNSLTCTCSTETCSMCWKPVKSCSIDEHREDICPKRSMKCAYCQETSLPFGDLYKHMSDCKYKQTFYPNVHDISHCHICGAPYSEHQKSEMYLMNSYHEDDPEEFGHWCPTYLWCPMCREFNTRNQGDLERHIRLCTGYDDGGNVYCYCCDTDLKNRADYESHLANDLCPEKVKAVQIMCGLDRSRPSGIEGRIIYGGGFPRPYRSWKEAQAWVPGSK